MAKKTNEMPVGERGWKLKKTEDGWRLFSCIANFLWEGPVVESDIPVKSNRALPDIIEMTNAEVRACIFGGIHAYRPANQLDSGDFRTFMTHQVATGTVSLFGKVVCGTQGFRAEKARVEEIVIHPMKAVGWNILETSISGVLDYQTQTPRVISVGYLDAIRIASDLEEAYRCPVTVEHWSWILVEKWRSLKSSLERGMRRLRSVLNRSVEKLPLIGKRKRSRHE